MSHVTYFIQQCPACGRTVHVRVEYLGRSVGCQHCGRKFVAYDPEGMGPPADSGLDLLERADALLRQAASSRETSTT